MTGQDTIFSPVIGGAYFSLPLTYSQPLLECLSIKQAHTEV